MNNYTQRINQLANLEQGWNQETGGGQPIPTGSIYIHHLGLKPRASTEFETHNTDTAAQVIVKCLED